MAAPPPSRFSSTVLALLSCAAALSFLLLYGSDVSLIAPHDTAVRTLPAPPRRLMRPPAPARCGRMIPIHGAFRPDAPPYFFPNASSGCPPAPVMTGRSWLSCMARRKGRLFNMGNSLGRGIAFTWASLLNNESTIVERSAQQESCHKTARDGDPTQAASCVVEVRIPPELEGELSDASVRFLWRPRWYNSSWGGEDLCGDMHPVDCYSRLFGAQPSTGDVLVVQTGLAYIEFGGTFRHLLTADFLNFIHKIRDAGIFRGTIVWLSTPLAHPKKNWGGHNVAIDSVLNAAPFASAVAAAGVRIVDFRRFADSVVNVDSAFRDAIHPPNEFYEAAVHAAAAQVAC